jgi:hypothetical protein
MIIQSKKKFVVGGPGAVLSREKFDGIAKVKDSGSPFEPIIHHNPLATFTTRGCPNKCSFCAVPVLEGDFLEIENFTPRPIICDNNFLFSSPSHFSRVIESLKIFPFVDFNQGLDASLFTPTRAKMISQLKNVKIRFAFDHTREERVVVSAIERAENVGFKNLGCYVLIGFNDNPDDALYRLELLRSLGVSPNPMRYQPLNTEKKNSHVGENWTGPQLRRFMKYWSRLTWYGHIPFEDFRPEVEGQGNLF